MMNEILVLKQLRDALSAAIERMEVTISGEGQGQGGKGAFPVTPDNVTPMPGPKSTPVANPTPTPEPVGPAGQTQPGPMAPPSVTPESDVRDISVADLQNYLARVARGVGGARVLNIIRKYALDGHLGNLDREGRLAVYAEVQKLAVEG